MMFKWVFFVAIIFPLLATTNSEEDKTTTTWANKTHLESLGTYMFEEETISRWSRAHKHDNYINTKQTETAKTAIQWMRDILSSFVYDGRYHYIQFEQQARILNNALVSIQRLVERQQNPSRELSDSLIFLQGMYHDMLSSAVKLKSLSQSNLAGHEMVSHAIEIYIRALTMHNPQGNLDIQTSGYADKVSSLFCELLGLVKTFQTSEITSSGIRLSFGVHNMDAKRKLETLSSQAGVHSTIREKCPLN